MDVESEGGWERGATVIGPSEHGDADTMRVRFADGVEDDWPTEDFRLPAKVKAAAARAAAAAAAATYAAASAGEPTPHPEVLAAEGEQNEDVRQQATTAAAGGGPPKAPDGTDTTPAVARPLQLLKGDPARTFIEICAGTDEGRRLLRSSHAALALLPKRPAKKEDEAAALAAVVEAAATFVQSAAGSPPTPAIDFVYIFVDEGPAEKKLGRVVMQYARQQANPTERLQLPAYVSGPSWGV